MNVAIEEKLKLVIRLEHDDDVESPVDGNCFSMINGFNSREELVDKLAEFEKDDSRIEGENYWVLSCYRHHGESWSLRGEGHTCKWDTTTVAGLLYTETGGSLGKWIGWSAAARATIETFNQWCAGDCWWYQVDKYEDVHEAGCCPNCKTPGVSWNTNTSRQLDSCGGFIGLGHAMDELISSIAHQMELDPNLVDTHEVVFQGDDSANYYKDDVISKVEELGFTSERNKDE
jgi:hypothetical protein|tara:strand:+ start:2723 stop:3415 length:693 start_codon:yes stop_codon:yes gene_type:complete